MTYDPENAADTLDEGDEGLAGGSKSGGCSTFTIVSVITVLLLVAGAIVLIVVLTKKKKNTPDEPLAKLFSATGELSKDDSLYLLREFNHRATRTKGDDLAKLLKEAKELEARVPASEAELKKMLVARIALAQKEEDLQKKEVAAKKAKEEKDGKKGDEGKDKSADKKDGKADAAKDPLKVEREALDKEVADFEKQDAYKALLKSADKVWGARGEKGAKKPKVADSKDKKGDKEGEGKDKDKDGKDGPAKK